MKTACLPSKWKAGTTKQWWFSVSQANRAAGTRSRNTQLRMSHTDERVHRKPAESRRDPITTGPTSFRRQVLIKRVLRLPICFSPPLPVCIIISAVRCFNPRHFSSAHQPKTHRAGKQTQRVQHETDCRLPIRQSAEILLFVR